jgi:hypothetical protein
MNLIKLKQRLDVIKFCPECSDILVNAPIYTYCVKNSTHFRYYRSIEVFKNRSINQNPLVERNIVIDNNCFEFDLFMTPNSLKLRLDDFYADLDEKSLQNYLTQSSFFYKKLVQNYLLLK